MRRRVDRVPRVPGDIPANRSLVLQRIEVFRLAAQQVDDGTILEQPAQLPFADEAREVGSEQRRKNRVGLRVDQRLHHRAGVDLAERHRLFDEFESARLPEQHLLLECRRRRLPVFIVGVNDGPTLLAELRRFRHQHGRLHERRRAQPERVLVAAVPHDLVGERFRRKEQHLALLREVGDGETDIRRKRSHQQRYFFAGDQLFGDTDGVARRAVVVARDDLDHAAVDASRGVDLGQRELHALLVRLQKRRELLVAVEFAQPDRLRCGRNRQRAREPGGGKDTERAVAIHAISSDFERTGYNAEPGLCVDPRFVEP